MSKSESSSRIVSISSKRQITIPQKYYEQLHFSKNAECFVRKGELVIRPVRLLSGKDFSEEILEKLILKGYKGEDLLKQFKLENTKMKEALEAMMDAASDAAEGKGESYSMEEVFGDLIE